MPRSSYMLHLYYTYSIFYQVSTKTEIPNLSTTVPLLVLSRTFRSESLFCRLFLDIYCYRFPKTIPNGLKPRSASAERLIRATMAELDD